MNYKKTIEYLYSLVPAYQKIGTKALKVDLSNITALCDAINNPQHLFKSIHVGGTNGKGTVSHLIASVLQEKGLKIGLYTSPHYKDFRERIKINGEYISEKEVMDFVIKMEEHIIQIEPSFFEVTVAMAFHHFHINKVDFAVIEVGLGGRLDSTNIISPELCVITNIGMDHTDYLGDTISKIAAEKAGIIKQNTPIVIGEYHSESSKVFIEKAKATDAPIAFSHEEWQSSESNDMIVHSSSEQISYEFHKKGPFHLSNSRTALTALLQLFPDLDKTTIESGINKFASNTLYKGRWQKIAANPDVIFDSGHNAHALEKTMSHLTHSEYQQIHFVLGFSRDKDVSSIVPYLPQRGKYYLSKIDMFRGAELDSFVGLFNDRSLSYHTYLSLSSAYAAALRSASSEDLIFVGGSSYVVGEILNDLDQ